jgi:hypothetical protein
MLRRNPNGDRKKFQAGALVHGASDFVRDRHDRDR